MLGEPPVDHDGVYVVTPSLLVHSMSQVGAAVRWVGASVRLSGVVLHVGGVDEARVRGLNDGHPYVVIADQFVPTEELARRKVPLPVAVCELDSDAPRPLHDGDAVAARGEVWGAAGRAAADLHCESVERR